MKEIGLTKGYVTIVDDEDYDRLNKHKWCYAYGYAVRSPQRINGRKGPLVFMHNDVLGRIPGKVVDHANRDGLDNRKENLRYADACQNKANQKWQKRKSSSGYIGVYYEPRINKWRARYQAYKKRVTIGYFLTPEEAAKAYDKAMADAFGEFAVLNLS